MTQTNPSCPYIITSDEGTSYCRLAEHSANSQPTPNPSQIRSSDITPPPELVQEWAQIQPVHQAVADHWQHIATRAAQWGSDQELEACCEWLVRCAQWEPEDVDELRAARRPQPQTLNSIAMQMLGTIERDGHYIPEITDTIRRALEELPDD
jgi:hypothetical protein